MVGLFSSNTAFFTQGEVYDPLKPQKGKRDILHDKMEQVKFIEFAVSFLTTFLDAAIRRKYNRDCFSPDERQSVDLRSIT